MYQLHFDGLYRQIRPRNASAYAASRAEQAGFMCYGWLIFKNGVLVARGHGVFAQGKNASSNSAEYLALIEGLEALADIGVCHEPVIVMGDAKSVLDQMSGQASVSSPAARTHYRRARKLVRGFTHLQWCWTPRQRNRAADQLTRRAMSEMRRDAEEYQAAVDALYPSHPGRQPARGLLALVDFRVYQNPGSSRLQ